MKFITMYVCVQKKKKEKEYSMKKKSFIYICKILTYVYNKKIYFHGRDRQKQSFKKTLQYAPFSDGTDAIP